MTRRLPAARTVLTCESGIGTASAADVYANETGWWQHDGGAFNASGTQIRAAGDGADGGYPIFGYNRADVNDDVLVTSLDNT